MHAIPISLAVVLGASFMSGCLGGGEEPGATSPTTSSPASPNPPVVEKKQEVTASDAPPNAFRFLPAALTAKLNETLNVTVVSPGGTTGNRAPHNFVIDEFNAKLPTNIQPGERKNVVFNATKTGSFTYYCNVGNHRQLGMEGTLTVS